MCWDTHDFGLSPSEPCLQGGCLSWMGVLVVFIDGCLLGIDVLEAFTDGCLC